MEASPRPPTIGRPNGAIVAEGLILKLLSQVRCALKYPYRDGARHIVPGSVEPIEVENMADWHSDTDSIGDIAHLLARDRSISEILGHQSVKIRLRYAHLSPAFLTAEVGLLDPPPDPPAGPARSRPSKRARLFREASGPDRNARFC